jgi:hypothetical protein
MDNSPLDIVLRRDWFVSYEDVFEILDALDRETYNLLLKNIYKYPQRIRDCIDPINWDIGPYKNWWGDYTDEQMAADKKEWGTICVNVANSQWKKYKEDNDLDFSSPPPSSKHLDLKREELNVYLAKKYSNNISYMARQTDLNIINIEKNIQVLENEYKLAKDIHKAGDDLRDADAKIAWHNQTKMRQVYETNTHPSKM